MHTVDEGLEENLFVKRPSFIVRKTALLTGFNGRTDVIAGCGYLATLFNLVVIAAVKCVHKLVNDRLGTVLLEVHRLELTAIKETECIID